MATKIIGVNYMKKKTLCIQVQDFSPAQDTLCIDYIIHFLHSLIDFKPGDFWIDVSEVEYVVNLNFSSEKILENWEILLAHFKNYETGCFYLLKKKWIVVAEGDNGWDDYVLLDSFNR